MTREHLTALVRHASSNHGIIDIGEIRSLGVSDRRRHHLTRTGLLEEVVPGIYVLAGLPLDWERRLRIGLRQVSPNGVAACFSAARVWDLPNFGRGPIEVVIGSEARRPSKPIGRLHRSDVLGHVDVTIRGDLRVTSPARTLLDIAPRIEAGHLDACVQDLARRGLLTVNDLASYLAGVRRRGRRGVRSLEQAMIASRGVV